MGDEDFGFDDFGAAEEDFGGDGDDDFGFDGFEEEAGGEEAAGDAEGAAAAAAVAAAADPEGAAAAATADSGSGSTDPPAAQPVKAKATPDTSTAKPTVPELTEKEDVRSWDSVTFTWPKLDQVVAKLQIQAMPAPRKGSAFAEGFDRKTGGKGLMIANPNEVTEATIPKLEYETTYQFRLVALNKHGKVEGPATGNISTLVYSPQRGDKSGWLIKRPNLRGTAGTLRGTRRLSLKKNKSERFFFVLDGALLSWFREVDAPQESGFLHLNKVKEISYINDEETTRLCLHLNDKDETTYELDVPPDRRIGIDPTANFKSWLRTLTETRVKAAGLEKATVKTIKADG